jgi:hypothetical protein
MSTIDQQLAANLEQFHEGLRRIENLKEELPGLGVSVDVSEDAKRQATRDLYGKHLAEYERLAQLKAEEVSSNLSSARQDLFRTKAMGYEPEIAMSQRDAQDRLRGVTDPSELSTRLAEAYELNDRIMTRAVLRHAVDTLGDIGDAGTSLVRQYLSLYPGDADAYSRLEDAWMAHEHLQQWGPGYQPMNPEDASRTFRSAGGGEIPAGLVTTITPDTGSAEQDAAREAS